MHRMAVKNLFDTNEVVFSNEELLKVIDYAITNNLISFEFKSANTLQILDKNIASKDIRKESNKRKINFWSDNQLQAEVYLIFQDDKELS